MRQTRTRQEIYSFLSNNHHAYTPYEIAKKTGNNPVTVYRVLEFLKWEKKVHHIPTIGKWSSCQCAVPNQDHSFLICRKCEHVEEFNSPHRCVHQSGFQCEEHITEIIWLCKNCH